MMGHHKAEYDRRVQLLQRASWARRAVEEQKLEPLLAIYLVVSPTARMLELQAEAKGTA